MPRTISGNGPWTVTDSGGFPWLLAIPVVGVTVVVVAYGHQITRVLHDALVVAAGCLVALLVAVVVTLVAVTGRRRPRPVPAPELAEDAAHEAGLETVRAGWPFTRPDGSEIVLPERARSRWN